MIRGNGRAIENTPEISAGIHNRFDVEVVDSETGELKQKAYAENIILDQLWTSYMGSLWFAYIQYGTGTGTPSASRASLFTYLGGKSAATPTSTFDAALGVFSLRKQIQISETEAVGSTLTEVGIAYNNSSSNLLTHAMLKDMNGNQISILKTATDIINIYATVFIHFKPEGYANGTIRVMSADNPSKIKSYSMQDVLFCLAGGIAFPDNYNTYAFACCENGKGFGFDFDCSNAFAMAFENIGAAKQVKCTMTRLGASVGNVGSFGQINAGGILFMVDLGGWFEGSVITGEAVATADGVQTDFDLAFPYADNAKIYVDGVLQSSVTVSYLPNKVNYGSEFNAIDASGSPVYLPKPYGNLYWHPDYKYGTYYYENPYAELVSIKTINVNYGSDYIYASPDLISWTPINNGSTGYITVPEACRDYRYWKSATLPAYGTAGFEVVEVIIPKAIHFDTAPPAGAVITADYDSRAIAKDANHVFDFNFILQLGEKTT